MLDLTASQGLQRAFGRAEIGVVQKAGQTKLAHLHQSGCVKALIPRNHSPRMDVVLINTSGGVTGGDHLRYRANLAAECGLTVTTQTAERIYRTSSGAGRIETHFEVGKSAQLDWLPQETILFDQSALSRNLTVEMDDTSHVMLLEPIVLGRKAMGEDVLQTALSDQWRVMRGGRLAYADALRMTDPTALKGTACLGENRAFATLAYIAPDAEARLDQMKALLNFDDVITATSAWNGTLVTRFIARDAQPLRAALITTLSQFRAHPLPRVWHM